MSLEAIRVGLLTVVLFVSLAFTAPNPVPDNYKPPPSCSPSYNITKYTLDFEDVSIPCFGAIQFCPLPVTRINITTPRGQGVAYTKYGQMERPLLIPNLSAWQVINCTWGEFANKDERFACANNSAKALYSPGKSPYDGSKPRLNTLDFPDTYIMGAVEAMNITPLRLPTRIKKATLELVGFKVNGKSFKHKVDLDLSSGKKQFHIANLKAAGFVDIKMLELWLVAGGKGGYEFALDNMDLEEYRPLPRPASCTPTPTPIIEPTRCTPPPQKTTWTANAEEFKTSTVVPTFYKSLTWNGYTRVLNASSFITETSIWPRGIDHKGNFYQSYSPFQVAAYQYEQRFGVKSLSVACGFWQWAEPDWSGTNNSPCTLSFVGRRDPYDGDGLPNLVVVNYTIPNPGRDATTQKFIQINLEQLTNSPGKFTRLYAFNVYARTGNYSYNTDVLLDNIVFTRSNPDDKKCRIPGAEELNFDDISVGSQMQKLPSIYKGFKFSDVWGVNKKQNYAPGTPGYQAVISQPNAAWAGFNFDPNSFHETSIDSYIDPAKQFLFNFEEATFTIDLPEYATNKTILRDVEITIIIKDACGSGTSYYVNSVENNPAFSQRRFSPDKLTFTYAEPIRAISQLYIQVWLRRDNFKYLPVFMDNFRYRKHDGPTPGCYRCGFRGGDYCELPFITPR